MPKLIDTDRLYRCTVQIFAECGFDAATTQDIARQAGVNEATLFRRHGTKTALIKAALTHCLSRSPFGRVTGSDDLRADLTALVEAYEATYRAYGGAVMTLLHEAGRHPDLRRVLAVLMPNIENAAKIIAGHQAKGRLRPGDTRQMVAFLIAPVLASGLWERAGATPLVRQFDAALVVERFLDGHHGPQA